MIKEYSEKYVTGVEARNIHAAKYKIDEARGGSIEQIKVLERALVPFRIVDKTLRLSCRDAEIEEFITRCNIKDYVIVDDDSREYGRSHSYLCNCKNGWTASDTIKCLKQLRL